MSANKFPPGYLRYAISVLQTESLRKKGKRTVEEGNAANMLGT